MSVWVLSRSKKIVSMNWNILFLITVLILKMLLQGLAALVAMICGDFSPIEHFQDIPIEWWLCSDLHSSGFTKFSDWLSNQFAWELSGVTDWVGSLQKGFICKQLLSSFPPSPSLVAFCSHPIFCTPETHGDTSYPFRLVSDGPALLLVYINQYVKQYDNAHKIP